MKPTIRKMRSPDLDELAGVLCAAYGNSSYNEKWTLPAAKKYLAFFFNIFPAFCFTAVSGKKIVGAVLGYDYPWLFSNIVHIQELFIHPDFHGKGIGRMLLSVRAKKYRGKKPGFITLVAKKHTPALKFYKKLGFFKSIEYDLIEGNI